MQTEMWSTPRERLRTESSASCRGEGVHGEEIHNKQNTEHIPRPRDVETMENLLCVDPCGGLGEEKRLRRWTRHRHQHPAPCGCCDARCPNPYERPLRRCRNRCLAGVDDVRQGTKQQTT